MAKSRSWNDMITVLASSFLLAVAGWWEWNSSFTLVLIFFVYLFFGSVFGKCLIKKNGLFTSWFMGALTILAGQSVIQTIWYYADNTLDASSDAFSLALCLLVFGILLPINRNEQEASQPTPEKKQAWHWFWTITYLLMAGGTTLLLLRLAWRHGTTEAIRAPWSLFPPGTLMVLAALAVVPLLAAARNVHPRVIALLSSFCLAAVTFLTSLLYKNGFGFDGFLHRASEWILWQTGTLTPKPLYYIGQYVFTTWFARITSVSLRWTDALLVPFASLLIPYAVYVVFQKTAFHRWAIAASIAVIPFAPLITTTPQSFAYILGFLGLCFAVSKNTHPLVSLVLSLWSASSHPLAGIPFFGGTILLLWIKRKIQKGQSPFFSFFTWLIVIGTGAAVPIAFFWMSQHGAQAIFWDISALQPSALFHAISSSFTFSSSHAALWPDWANAVIGLTPFALIIGAGAGMFVDKQQRPFWIGLALLAGMSWLAGWILHASSTFAFLIDYERGTYADRLFIVSQFFLVLPACAGLARGIARAMQSTVIGSATVLLFFSAWTSASAYNALPRHDAAATARGWSTSRADKEAVNWIDEQNPDRPYTVLANQSVSAAAVEAFGFKRYAGDVFFYSIPTGGPLYQTYLHMAYGQPATSTIVEAAKLGQSNRVYVVLNDYWWDYERITEALSAVADNTHRIQNGKVTIFFFHVK